MRQLSRHARITRHAPWRPFAPGWRFFSMTSRQCEMQPDQAAARSRYPTTFSGDPLDRTVLEAMLRRRMFYAPSFEAYGGIKGLFDLGPPGCSLQANIVDLWRKHFVLEEDMLELDCTALTPEEVLKTSGHVEKFSDWMCKDLKTGEIIRADHFVKEILEQRLEDDRQARDQANKPSVPAKDKQKKRRLQPSARLDDTLVQEYEEVLAQLDNYNGEELGDLIKKYDLRNPASGEQPSPPQAFNLMFETTIGATSSSRGYLRPETAQGQFLNFSRLLAFNQKHMPFASASVGKSFRNELSPRAGLLRVREFLMAEIEHFVDPQGGKTHERFDEVKDVELELLTRNTQLAGKTVPQRISIGQAVAEGIVDNETLGYFLARIHIFLQKIGVDQAKVRFRQHMSNEMAHYATDCWDAELLTSYGWIECVGCADRSAYDLSVHAQKTGAPFYVQENLPQPVTIEEWQIDINRKNFGPRFKKDGKSVDAALQGLNTTQREELAQILVKDGKITIDVNGLGPVELGRDLISFERRTSVEHTRAYIPNVIEPSFGIGRILYALLEHNYWTRDGEAGDLARGVLSFPAIVAPTKVLIAPLLSQPRFEVLVSGLARKLRSMGITCRVDASGATIGRRYSRQDELGTPLAITVDFESLDDGTLTLRDRDSMQQVRGEPERILRAVAEIVRGDKSWADVTRDLSVFERREEGEQG